MIWSHLVVLLKPNPTPQQAKKVGPFSGALMVLLGWLVEHLIQLK
jgi:hypothetical protein